MENDKYSFLSAIMDLMLDAVCVVDRDGRFVFVSAGFERIFGYAPADIVGRSMIDFVFADDRDKTLQTVDAILAGELRPLFENRWVHRSGRIVHVMWSARWSEQHQVRIAVARDITEHKHNQSRQAALYAVSEAAYTAPDQFTLFQRIHHLVGEWFPDANLFVALHDPVADRLAFPYSAIGFNRDTASCQDLAEKVAASVMHRSRPQLLSANRATSIRGCDLTRMAGTNTLESIGIPLQIQGNVIGALIVQSGSADLQYSEKHIELLQFVATQTAAAIQRLGMELQLLHMARHDALTDLPNRALFQDRLQTALALARRDRAQLALLFIDLDGFKEVNDSLGHPLGDLLLQQVAERLRNTTREVDTAGRIGGDEFVVLLGGVHSSADALLIAEKIRGAIAAPYLLAGCAANISPSIGIAVYPEHGDNYLQLLEAADKAMYRAKGQGGNQSILFAAN